MNTAKAAIRAAFVVNVLSAEEGPRNILDNIGISSNHMCMQDELIGRIVGSITSINPDRIILFGSHARGNASPDSDIDILVVTGDDYMPRTFSEKSSVYQRISNLITDVERVAPVDLIVYTRPMYRKFLELGSMFSKKISSEGIILYEKNH